MINDSNYIINFPYTLIKINQIKNIQWNCINRSISDNYIQP